MTNQAWKNKGETSEQQRASDIDNDNDNDNDEVVGSHPGSSIWRLHIDFAPLMFGALFGFPALVN